MARVKLLQNMPKSGIQGAVEIGATTILNFFNAAGAGFNAFLSGLGAVIGTLVSGTLASGATNTASGNYNNQPPQNVMYVFVYVSNSTI